MRLLSLAVDGFRGFAKEQSFDLDADAIVVVGSNGNGKTSLFDAILWVMSGRIPRLGADNSMLRNKFSDTGQARVSLRLSEAPGAPPTTITRVFDGVETRVSIESGGHVSRGPEAEGKLIQMLWADAGSASDPCDALATVLTRSVYLQQDLVRQFIDSASDQDRFVALSELVGAGRVTSLQAELERAKASWTKATNVRASELAPSRTRLSAMESRLAEIRSHSSHAQSQLDERAWDTWWDGLRAMKGLERVRAALMGSTEAAAAIDDAIQQIDAIRRATQRRLQLLDGLSNELAEAMAAGGPDLLALQDKVASLRKRTAEARQTVSAEQAHAAERRRLQSELADQAQQIRALAELALRHLGDTCPVCGQAYDLDHTRRRLESMVLDGARVSPSSVSSDALPGLLSTLTANEKALAEAEVEMRDATRAARDRAASELAIGSRFSELGFRESGVTDKAVWVQEALAQASREIEALAEAQRRGEEFALLLSMAADLAASRELEQEIVAISAKVKQEEEELARRNSTGEEAQCVIEALREAASAVVAEKVREMEPFLSDVYSRVDVHPAFSAVRFLASLDRGRGQLATLVEDPLTAAESDRPGSVFSSSQLNGLAVCVFLTLNANVAQLPLEAALLDDPLQSLDDVNLLGLVDLLRRMKDQRQICVSTHDARFGNLLARKLRPRLSTQRTLVIELEGWSRAGPVVTLRDIPGDPRPLRLVAS